MAVHERYAAASVRSGQIDGLHTGTTNSCVSLSASAMMSENPQSMTISESATLASVGGNDVDLRILLPEVREAGEKPAHRKNGNGRYHERISSQIAVHIRDSSIDDLEGRTRPLFNFSPAEVRRTPRPYRSRTVTFKSNSNSLIRRLIRTGRDREFVTGARYRTEPRHCLEGAQCFE